MSPSEIVIIILFVIIALLLAYILISRLRMRTRISRECKIVREDADHEVRDRTQALLRLAIVPLQWAVRAEMLRNNLQEIEHYFAQFVREPGVSYIALTDSQQNIIIASDKSSIGNPLTRMAGEVMDTDKLSIIERDHDEKLILAPITGMNERLGTVAVVYHPREA